MTTIVSKVLDLSPILVNSHFGFGPKNFSKPLEGLRFMLMELSIYFDILDLMGFYSFPFGNSFDSRRISSAICWGEIAVFGFIERFTCSSSSLVR